MEEKVGDVTWVSAIVGYSHRSQTTSVERKRQLERESVLVEVSSCAALAAPPLPTWPSFPVSRDSGRH